MEVSYITTLDDYVAFSLHSLKKSRSMKWRFALAWVLPPVVCWLWADQLANSNPPVATLLAVGGVAHAVGYPFFRRAWVGSAVRAFAQDLGARGVIGRITLVLAEDTFTERTESVQSVARWRDMKGVEVVGDCTYIYLTGLLAAIVPRRGFERPEDYEAVMAFALAKLGTTTEPPSRPA